MYINHISTLQLVIPTTGAAGSAEGELTSIPIMGFLLDVKLDYNAAAPATTHVTITDPVFGDLLVVADTATDGVYAPRKQICDAAGAAQPLYDLIPLNSELTISVINSDELTDCVTVTLRWVTP